MQAGYLAVREYGQRLDHALGEFAAQEEAVRRHAIDHAGHGRAVVLRRGGSRWPTR